MRNGNSSLFFFGNHEWKRPETGEVRLSLKKMTVMKITLKHVFGIHLAVVYAGKVHSVCRKCGSLVEFQVYFFCMLLVTPGYYDLCIDNNYIWSIECIMI